ncbi:CobW family GTP-binding protein [Actinokineospora iranica]|uniref:GTPase, G3E family n=1 Tax=Actinokineospora iranica TaxID=1271860 RepID=A0A1G6MV01_9PSEU|nr:GTP-binding protein [Actinokineospora iranica]SDC58796.1 GTPase, G3E family [Actinokineospora iranica]
MTIPVLVVAGFLGSGKTTLLNHLLRATTGLRIGVVVNDFGRVNIDAMTVAAQVDSMVTLGNGCLCCAVDVADLDAMLDRLAKPDGPVDVIVVEASGLAEPPAMVRLVLGSENPLVTYGGLVEVVDAAEFDATRERHPQIDKHLRYADLVLLNKTDRVDPATRDRLLTLVRDLSDGVPVVPTDHGRVDPDLLFDPVDRPDPVARQLSFEDLIEPEPHIHAGYESVEFTSDQPMNPHRFMRFLTDRPTGLYRMKGYAHFGVPGHDDPFHLHTVGAHLSLTLAPDAPRRTQLVMIGAALDATAITTALTAAVEPDPASVDPLDMLSVTRYLPR